MKKIIFVAAVMLFVVKIFAAVDTVLIYSNAMHKNSKAVIVTPTNYSTSNKKYPVIYLLHGYSGSYNNWIKKAPLQKYSDNFQVIFVCPDGGFSSWYFDSPVDSTYKYETYVGIEVPAFIDAHYNTIANRKGRAITGLSMGGHGGLFLGFRHADIFGACGSMSGGVDLHYSHNKFDIKKRIGDTINYANNWEKYSVINVIEHQPVDTLKIIFDCGVNDIFYENNKALHAKMLALKINHDYIERPGKHEWAYWINALPYQLLFFSNYFGNLN